jgi:hypothetical protein
MLLQLLPHSKNDARRFQTVDASNPELSFSRQEDDYRLLSILPNFENLLCDFKFRGAPPQKFIVPRSSG